MEHIHGFDFMPDQFRAMCNCGEMRINPTYNPTLGKLPYYAFYCGCGEYSTGNSAVEYTTFAELHSHCRRPAHSTVVHLHLGKSKNKLVRIWNRLQAAYWNTYTRFLH